MKQSDIFSIIIIATVGTLASYFGVNAFLGDPDLASVQVKTINEISPDLAEPDSELFNPGAINPTVEVFVGDCEDVDQNGILSHEELVACGKVVDEQPEDENGQGTLYYCADGTLTQDTSLCPENKQQTQVQQPAQSTQQQTQTQQQTVNQTQSQTNSTNQNSEGQ